MRGIEGNYEKWEKKRERKQRGSADDERAGLDKTRLWILSLSLSHSRAMITERIVFLRQNVRLVILQACKSSELKLMNH